MDWNQVSKALVKIVENDAIYVVKSTVNDSLVRFVVDTEQGIAVEQLIEINSKILNWFENNEIIQPKIEVSSPGIYRSFSDFRAYKKNIGRLIRVKLVNSDMLADELTIEGRLMNVENESFQIEIDGNLKEIEFSGVLSSKLIENWKEKKN